MSDFPPAIEALYCTDRVSGEVCGSPFVVKSEEIDLGDDVWVRGECLGMNEESRVHALNCPKWMLRVEIVGIDMEAEAFDFPDAEQL